MFKRVAKRIRKQEEEDALGLDAEMKQVLGLNDTDSEESDDDSSDDGSFAGLGGLDDEEGLGEDGEEMDKDEDPDLFEDDEESDSEADDQPQKIKMKMSISQALKDPIFLNPEDAMNKLCAICVGKKLKTENLAHERRMKQFIQRVKGADPEEDAFAFVRAELNQKPAVLKALKQEAEYSIKSKRALKKEASKAFRKAKRDRAKEKARAKKEAASTETPGTPPPTSTKKPKKALASKVSESPARPAKKRRVEDKDAADTEVNEPTVPSLMVKKTKPSTTSKSTTTKTKEDTQPSTNSVVLVAEPPKPTISSIAKSASDRAKTARFKAVSALKSKSKSSVRGLKRKAAS